MKTSLAYRATSAIGARARARADSRLVLLVLFFFLLGVGLAGFWFHHRSKQPAAVTPVASLALSDSTLAVLGRLNSPIEIRFYSLLDPATVPDPVRAFAGRVNDLLARYEQAANGRIKITRVDTPSNANANSAEADGIKPFNQDKGDACYLGIAVVHGDKKESLPQLAPDWEPALESDLSRAIVRLNENSAVLATATPAPIDPATKAELETAVPNYASISTEEGTRVLRQSAQDELVRMAKEMDARMKEAQQRFLDAEKNQSAADQEAARQQLLQLQAEQNQKIKQIIAKSQAQVELLQRLKTGDAQQ